MLLDTRFFFFSCFVSFVCFSLTSGKSLFSRAASLWPRCGMRQQAQYCETGGAVDSMLEVFIVNCLFLYRSKVRVQMTKKTPLTHLWVVHVISTEAGSTDWTHGVSSGAVWKFSLEIACSTSEAKEQGERLWSLGESEEPIYNWIFSKSLHFILDQNKFVTVRDLVFSPSSLTKL